MRGAPVARRQPRVAERRTAALLFLGRQVHAAGGWLAVAELLSRQTRELDAIFNLGSADQVTLLARQIERARSPEIPV